MIRRPSIPRPALSFAQRWCERDVLSFSHLWAVRGRVAFR